MACAFFSSKRRAGRGCPPCKNKYVDADCADYAAIRYWTSAESAKSASEILNQIEWCDFIGTLQAFQIANAINFKWQAWPALFVRATLAINYNKGTSPPSADKFAFGGKVAPVKGLSRKVL